MAKTSIDTWTPNFFTSPLFEPIQALAPQIKHFITWPTLNDYQNILESAPPVHSKHNQIIRFVSQGSKPDCFEDQYEARIFLKGEVQTRLENWHDFFQVLVWRSFPRTKIELNALHYQAAIQRLQTSQKNKNRSPIENAITLFDECGVIIVTSNPGLGSLIREHQWKQLFWHQREELQKQLKCVVFGHALYEKALTPYIGMTGHGLILTADQEILDLSQEELVLYCDEQVAKKFTRDHRAITSPKDLCPFPLLGMPGWHPDNHQESFYDNTQYFRAKR